jgi:hypothetical protein
MEPRNRFQRMNSASLCSLAGRYDNPIPPRFVAPIVFLKIPAQDSGYTVLSKSSFQEVIMESAQVFGYFDIQSR